MVSECRVVMLPLRVLGVASEWVWSVSEGLIGVASECRVVVLPLRVPGCGQ